MLSMKAAYLKTHYPAEFMAAVISNGGGYYTPLAYISEARRMGLTVPGPDINESEWQYEGKDKTIRTGLMQLKEIRHETVMAILNERTRNGPYTSLEDLSRRVELSPSDAPILVKSGTLDSISGRYNRPQALWFMVSINNPSHVARDAQITIFQRPQRAFAVPSLPDISEKKRWQQEIESLGFVLSVHPLKLYESSIRTLRHPITSASRLHEHVGSRVRVLGWPVTRKEVYTKEGEAMEFISLEDASGIYEAVLFPVAFRRFCRDVVMDQPYILAGKVEEEFGAVSLTVQEMHRLMKGA
jgi:error-prone DNA polymerase